MAETRLRISKQLWKSTTPGSVIVTDNNNEQQYIAPGSNGQVLQIVAGIPTWVNSAAGFTGFSITDGTTTEGIAGGDTITFTGTDKLKTTVSATDTVTFSIDKTGALAGQQLTFDGTNIVWATSGVDCNNILNNGAEQSAAITPTNIVDANSNVTTPNVNGDIPTSTLDVIGGKVELDNISKIYNVGVSSGFTAMSNGTFVLATTGDIDLTPIHQNMSENFYLDPTAYFNYSIGTTTNYVFSTQVSTDSGATWSNWEVGSAISIAPSGPSTGTYYLTANDDLRNSIAPSTVRYRAIVTVTGYNGGNILSTLIRARGIGVVGVKI